MWDNSTEFAFVTTAGNASSTTLGLKSALTGTAAVSTFKLEIGGIVKQAMIYPTVVATAGYGMVLFMLSFVVPRLGGVLEKITDPDHFPVDGPEGHFTVYGNLPSPPGRPPRFGSRSRSGRPARRASSRPRPSSAGRPTC